MNKIALILLAFVGNLFSAQKTWQIAGKTITAQSLGCVPLNFEKPPTDHKGPLRELTLQGNFINDGGLGSIYKGKLGNKPCAVKAAPTSDEAIREIYMLRIMEKVPRIPRVLACEIYPDETYFALQLYESDMHGKEARKAFHDNNGFKSRLRVYEGLAETLQEIHKMNIVYSDIKPENVMALNTQYTSLHLVDFNSSFFVGEKFRFGTNGFGSYNFINNREAFNLQADDVWALIVTIVEIEFNNTAFVNYLDTYCSRSFTLVCYATMILMLKQMNHADYRAKLRSDGCSVTLADRFVQLMINGLERDPKKRITAQDLASGLNSLFTECVESTKQLSEYVSIENDATVNRPLINIDASAEYFYPKNPKKEEVGPTTNGQLSQPKEKSPNAVDKKLGINFSVLNHSTQPPEKNSENPIVFKANRISGQEAGGVMYPTRRLFGNGPDNSSGKMLIPNSHLLDGSTFENHKGLQIGETFINDGEVSKYAKDSPMKKVEAVKLRVPRHGIERAPTQEEIRQILDDLNKVKTNGPKSSRSLNENPGLLAGQKSSLNPDKVQPSLKTGDYGLVSGVADSKESEMSSISEAGNNNSGYSFVKNSISELSLPRTQTNRNLAQQSGSYVPATDDHVKVGNFMGKEQAALVKVYL